MSVTERIAKLRKIMEEKNISAALLTGRSNVFYFSGFNGDSGDLLITKEVCYILVDSRFTEQALMQAGAYHVIDITKDLDKKISEIILSHHISHLWFEDRNTSFAAYTGMQNKVKPALLVPSGAVLEQLRLIKDEEEIESIKKAVEISDAAFSHVLRYIKAGVSEIEIAAEIEYFMRKHGAEKTAFDTIAISGPNTSLPHGKPTERRIAHGDMVMLDYGCVYQGYCSDMTRCVAIGKVSARQQEIYNVVLYTQLKVLHAMKCGDEGAKIDDYAREILKSFGVGKFFGHGLGHGVGLDVHEMPSFKSSGATLLPGMLMTVEPGVYLPGEFGVRIEDLVLIKENEIEVLTKSTKELLILS